MKLSIPKTENEFILNELGKANKAFQKIYSGDKPDRQPVHTVYGGADLFSSDTAEKMGQAALNTLLNNAPNFVEFARAIELTGYNSLPTATVEIENLIKKWIIVRNPNVKKRCIGWLIPPIIK